MESTMIEKLFTSMKAALASRWDYRMTDVLNRAADMGDEAILRFQNAPNRDAALGQAVREAYLTGVREAYWDGMVDFVEVAMAAESAAEMESERALIKMTADSLSQPC